MEIPKALVLAGGTPGDVPWPSVDPTPKALVPVANRPILFHNLETLRRARVSEAAIAVTPTAASAIREAVGDGSAWDLNIRIAEYRAADGVEGVLSATRAFIGDEPVLVQQADALVREPIHRHITAFANDRIDALVLRLPSAVSPAREQGAGAGAWLLSRRAVAMLREQHPIGADPVTYLRERGGGVRAVDIDGCLLGGGGQDALLEGNRRMLEELRSDYDERSLTSCELQGQVVVHPTARLERTLVRGPVVIGPGVQLVDAYVGPYTSIGPDVTIEGTEIEHSIVLAGAQLRFLGTRIASSVIGERARIVRGFAIPAAMRLSIGADADVHFP